MAKDKSALSVLSKAIDPALDALFSQSAGPVKTPPKSRYAELLPKKSLADEEDHDGFDGAEPEGSDEESEASENGSEERSAQDAKGISSADDEAEATKVSERVISRGTSQEEGRKRKRKQRDGDEDFEAKYLERLADDEAPSGKRRKADATEKTAAAEDAGRVSREGDDERMAGMEEDESSVGEAPVHESLTTGPVETELEKANRTVFLSNVSIEAITSRKAKKMLLHHLSSVLDKKADPPQKVQSIRFRSIAFATTGIPKRVAYIKKSLLEATTKSTNAYVVYSTAAAARLAVAQLNGTVVLDRHLRVDSVAHPAPVDHRRCVFVGNLGFVDDETVYSTKIDKEGKEITEKRKRTKTPMDVEEGLWRVFGEEAGKVESVRVVRDAATRVGKGFAYVQFYDGNAVESAILLNGKKFPPMLPRELRVSRCKAPHKTARAMEARREKIASSASSDRKGGGKHDGKKRKKRSADGETGEYVPKLTADAQTLAGRASKLLGRFGAAKLVGELPGKDKKRRRDRRERGIKGRGGEAAGEKPNGIKGPEQFVFEGRRASAKDGKPKDLKFKTKSKGKDKVHKKKKKKGAKGEK
ncbi:195ab6e3-3369-4626-bb7a-0cb9584b4d8f [Thermothielavioides terrestris]|uniref:Nucleolar protein 12 n=1 Tax=Thermothielavioides terrestris TaxID=2587410 RepID=A0A3S4BEM9_9PEZI|nr:195ab6e3-3369-4626-bb7a-0cb9584b4d8f [Thermothielavioides terrestris]